MYVGGAWLTRVRVSFRVKAPSSLFPSDAPTGINSGSILTLSLCGDTEAHAEMGVLAFQSFLFMYLLRQSLLERRMTLNFGFFCLHFWSACIRDVYHHALCTAG